MSDVNNSVEENYFKRNRYVKEDMLVEFEKIETINKIFYLDISQNDNLEIHVHEEINRDFIKEVISEIPTFDNYVQDFCESNSKMSKFAPGNYRVSLAWISIEQNKVVMGYWGEFVNIELRSMFVKNNSVWENDDIYWQ